jgi:hypothetical protein
MCVSRRFSRKGRRLSGRGRVVVPDVEEESGGMGMWGRFSMVLREHFFFVGIVVQTVEWFFGFGPKSISPVFRLRF